MKREDPLSLVFHFTDKQGDSRPLYFTNPKKCSPPIPLGMSFLNFKKSRKPIEQGHYAAGYVSYEAAPAF